MNEIEKGVTSALIFILFILIIVFFVYNTTLAEINRTNTLKEYCESKGMFLTKESGEYFVCNDKYYFSNDVLEVNESGI